MQGQAAGVLGRDDQSDPLGAELLRHDLQSCPLLSVLLNYMTAQEVLHT